jgi:hypothetical protein
MTSGQDFAARIREQARNAVTPHVAGLGDELRELQNTIGTYIQGLGTKLDLLHQLEVPMSETIVAEAVNEATEAAIRQRDAERMALAQFAHDLRARETQEELLNMLLDGASRFAPRVGLFIVREESFQGWACRGFSEVTTTRFSSIGMPREQSPLMQSALTSEGLVSSPDFSAESGEDLAFMAKEASGPWHAFPLIAINRPVAVLVVATADANRCDLESLCLVMNITGLCLENLALKILQELRTQSYMPARTPVVAHPPATAAIIEEPITVPPPPIAEEPPAAVPEEPQVDVAPEPPAAVAEVPQAEACATAALEQPPAAEPILAAQEPVQEPVPVEEVTTVPDTAVAVEPAPVLQALAEAQPEPVAAEVSVVSAEGVASSPIEEGSAVPVQETAETPSIALPPPAQAEPDIAVIEEPAPIPVAVPEAEEVVPTIAAPPPAEPPAPPQMAESLEMATAASSATPAAQGWQDSTPVPPPKFQPVAVPPLRPAVLPAASDAQQLSEEEKLHSDAKRFARLLVSEIKLYNEQRVLEGREHRDVYVRLKRDIDRSREMYQKRVAPSVVRKVDYFHDEIVRILGDNDPSTLGSDYPGPLVES